MRSSRHPPARARRARSPVPALSALVLVLVLAGCQGTGSITGVTTATPTLAPPTGTSTSTGYPIKVFFSKHPESDQDTTKVFGVDRVSPALGVADFAMRQLIAGPVAAETAAGYYTELAASLTGSSNCGGPDFRYSVVDATHTGTLQLCRPTQLAGDLTGPRIKAEITATLTQFPNVTKVIILDSQGQCLDDASGMNACLH